MRPRTLASTRSEPTWRTIPPIRAGSTLRVASTERPEDFSIFFRIDVGLVVGELVRRRQLDGQPLLLGRDERFELAVDLVDLRRPPLLGEQGRKLRISSSAPPRISSSAAVRSSRVELRVREHAAQLGHLLDRGDEVAELARGRPRAASAPSPPRRATARTCGAATATSSLALQRREVEVADRVLDQLAVVVAVEHLAGHLRGRDERELGDLGADLLERADRLGLDLLARLLEPALPVGLDLLLGALALRLGDLARLGEDLPRLALGLADQLLVLLEQPAGLGARVLRLLDRGADALAALVDRLLDRAERELPQDEERDREADERPDHQTRDDVDQR